MMEMSLMGTVTAAKLPRLLDGLERSCGPGASWDLLETTFALEGKELKVRWTPGENTMQIAHVTPPVRVTSRPDGQMRAMEQVLCRPLKVVSDGGSEHLKVLTHTGFQKKFVVYQRGLRCLLCFSLFILTDTQDTGLFGARLR